MRILKKTPLAFFRLSLIAGFAFTMNCNNTDTIITGIEDPIHEIVTEITPSVLVWGNYFSSTNGGYSELLERCRRCGRKRVSPSSFGGAVYEVHVPFSSRSPRRCSNWNARGYLQIEFAEERLPTTATVTIQPEYSKGSKRFWGEPFSIQSTANAINENKGFQIILTPKKGLGGTKNLYIYSESNNQLDGTEMGVTVTYGEATRSRRSSAPAIISETLDKLTKRTIEKVQYSCSDYIN